MRRTLVLVGLVCLVCVLASSTSGKEPVKAKPGADVIWPEQDLAWVDGPVPGSHVAQLWGDWNKGAFGALVRFDAGMANKLHHHSHDLRIVVISGTYSHTPEGGTEVVLPPGSYLVQAGMKNHVSGCGGGAGCEFFITSDHAFDLIPAK